MLHRIDMQLPSFKQVSFSDRPITEIGSELQIKKHNYYDYFEQLMLHAR